VIDQAPPPQFWETEGRKKAFAPHPPQGRTALPWHRDATLGSPHPALRATLSAPPGLPVQKRAKVGSPPNPQFWGGRNYPIWLFCARTGTSPWLPRIGAGGALLGGEGRPALPRGLFSLLAIAVLACAGCGHSKAPADAKADTPTPVVQIVPVSRRTLERVLPVSGTLKTLQTHEATITPPVAGVLDALPVRYGQAVQKGQIVAHLATGTLAGPLQQAQATLGQNQVQVQQAQANALQQQAQTRTAIAQAQSALAGAQAAVKREQAALTGSLASLENAQQNLVREQTLYADGLVAQKDVEAAQLAVRTAQAQVDAQRQTVDAQRQAAAGQGLAVQSARAAALQDVVKQKDVQVARRQVQNARGALATARAQSALYTIRAPLSGQVTSVGATVGESVDTATKLAVIADLRTLVLEMGVPSDTARQVRTGQTVTFSSGGRDGKLYQSVIYNVGAQVNAATGTVPALALVSNAGGRLRDDSIIKAHVVTERRSGALVVPKAALLTDPDTSQTSVVVVGTDEIAHIVPVKAGLAANGLVEITQGLAEGQHVAVSGQYGLPDKSKVSVQPAAPQGSTHGP